MEYLLYILCSINLLFLYKNEEELIGDANGSTIDKLIYNFKYLLEGNFKTEFQIRFLSIFYKVKNLNFLLSFQKF